MIVVQCRSRLNSSTPDVPLFLFRQEDLLRFHVFLSLGLQMSLLLVHLIFPPPNLYSFPRANVCLNATRVTEWRLTGECYDVNITQKRQIRDTKI